MLRVTNRAPGDERPGLLVLGHLDTVHPIGTLELNPCRIENDRLYGPGGYDMKAGAYLAVTALGRVSANGGTTPLPVDILLVPDEEVGTHHSRKTIERYARTGQLDVKAYEKSLKTLPDLADQAAIVETVMFEDELDEDLDDETDVVADGDQGAA